MGVITGSKGAFYQPATWGRNEAGNYSLWTFRGTRDEVYATAASYAQVEGLVYEVTESFGMHELKVRFPWNMQGIDPRTDKVENWELFANTVEKDLLSTQLPNPLVSTLTPGQIAKIRFLLSDPPDITDTANFPSDLTWFLAGSHGFPVTDPGNTPTNAQNAYLVWTRMRKGVLNFPEEAPVLRHTITTSRAYQIGVSFLNLRSLMRTNFLYAFEGAPANYLFNLPPDPPITNPEISPVDGTQILQFAWRKVFPTVNQIALLKWQIVQEYHYGLWDTTFWPQPLST